MLELHEKKSVIRITSEISRISQRLIAVSLQFIKGEILLDLARFWEP